MDKVYTGYEIQVNKNIEDIAYNGRMLKIEGNSKQKVIEAVEGKSVTGEIIRATDIQNENGRVIIEGNSKQKVIEAVEGKSVTGESINVQDVELINGRVIVEGNSKQAIRSGKNQLKITNFENKTISGVTFTAEYGINGELESIKAIGNSTTNYMDCYRVNISNLPAGNYIVNGLGTNKIIRFVLLKQNDTEAKTITSDKDVSFTQDSSSPYTTFRIDLYQTGAIDIKIKPMIRQSSITDSSYESYGASPTIDYPSKIETCGDNINLLPYPYFQTVTKTENGITWTINSDGSIKVSGTSTGTSFIDLYNNGNKKLVIPNKRYIYKIFKNGETNFSLHYYSNVSGWKDIITGTNERIFTAYNNNSTGDLFRVLIEGSGKTVDETIYPVLIEGDIASGYSPYGQGSINEVICNKNLFDYDKTSYGFYNSSGKYEDAKVHRISNFLKAESNKQYIASSNRNIGYLYIYEFDKNQNLLKRSALTNVKENLITTTNSTKYIRVSYNIDNYIEMTIDKLKEIQAQLEEGSIVTEYEEHKEQTFIIPTHPLRSIGDVRDTFVKVNGKWFERHNTDRVIFNGTESWQNVNGYGIFYINNINNLKVNTSDNILTGYLSTHFKEITTTEINAKKEGFCVATTNRLYFFHNGFSPNENLEGFKAWLQEQYNAGTPVYVDYILATPNDIECTPEQIEVLEKLYNTNIYIPETNIYSLDKTSSIKTLEYNYVIASPSVEVPSEVESCGDNVNLLPIKQFNNQQHTGLTLNSNGDGSIVINGTTTEATTVTISSGQFNIHKGIYTFSIGDTKLGGFNVFLQKSDYTNIELLSIGASNTQITKELEEITIRSVNIYANKGVTFNNYTIKPKLEKGYNTPYSPYGQGCINEVIHSKKINDNSKYTSKCYLDSLGDVVTNEYWLITDYVEVEPNKKYVYEGINTIGVAPYSVYYDKDKKVISTFKLIDGTNTIETPTNAYYIRFSLNHNTTHDINTFKLYEGQTFSIPTQQPMRSIDDYGKKIKDIFIKKGNHWYERHYINRQVLKGTEAWNYTNNIFSVNLQDMVAQTFYSLVEVPPVYSSHYTMASWNTYGNANNMASVLCYGWTYTAYRIRDDRFTTYESFKSYLAEQYNAGEPVYFDYILATPNDIECTPEQIEVLEKLYNTNIYIPETNIYSLDKTSSIKTLEYNYVIASPSIEIPSEVESCGDNVNLFDKDNANILGVYFTSTDTILKQGTVAKSLYIPITGGKTYSVSKNAGKRFNVGTTEIIPQANVALIDNAKNFNNNETMVNSTKVILKTSSNAKYLVVLYYASNADTLTEQEILDSIKIVEGTEIGEYSPYGQGSINEVICNKNLFNLGEDSYTNIGLEMKLNKSNLTINGTSATGNAFKTKGNITGMVHLGKFKAGTYMASCKVISGSYSASTWTKYFVDGAKQSLGDFGRGANTMVVTLKEDTDVYFQMWCGAQIIFNNYSMDIQLEEGTTATEVVEHQSQIFTIPTQQLMKSIRDIRDIFIKKGNHWYERHYINRKIFNGTENWTYISNTRDRYAYSINLGNKILGTHLKEYSSNMFEQKPNGNWDKDGFVSVSNTSRETYLFVSHLSTVAELKKWLKEEYDKGTPVYVDYILETPNDIKCTPEQEIILEKLQNIPLYDGENNIFSLDSVEPLLTFEYYYKMKDYDFYLSSDGYFNIPSLGIRYLVDLNESSIPTMPEAVESSVRVAGRDGDVPLNTTYEPISFNIVCYTEDNLTAMEKTEQENKINNFLNSIKNKTKKFAIERNTRFYEVKYSGALTTINYPKFLKFSIPLKSSESYGKDITEKIMIGNEKINSNTMKEAGALITINGPAISPIISLNDYSIEYSADIIDGAKIEIDTSKSTVTHINPDGVKTNVMKFYNHQFPKIENGENELKMLSGLDNKSNVNIKWNDLKL